MVDEKTCNRCGMCCHYEHDGKIYKCKHLVYIGRKSHCRIYRNRLGKIIARHGDKIVRCTERRFDPREFPGCPYNGMATGDTE